MCHLHRSRIMATTVTPASPSPGRRSSHRPLTALLLAGWLTASVGYHRPEELAAQASREAVVDPAQHIGEAQEVLARALPSQTPSEQLWSEFRATFPYHVQVFAL